MEIFKVSKKDDGIAVGQIKVAGEQPAGDKQGFTMGENEELAHAQKMTGEKITKVNSEGEVSNDDADFNLGGRKEGSMIVKVEGPLGHIFTNALNKILAFESMVLVPIVVEELEKENEDNTYNSTTSIHVQAYDASELTTNDVVEISSSITKTVKDDQILVMESARGISNASGSALGICNAVKAKSYMKIDTAASRVAAIIRDKVSQ